MQYDTVLLGSAEDERVLRGERDRWKLSSHVLAGRLSLLGLVCFFRRCRAVLTIDSGPRHLANAAGVPVCFVPNLAVAKIETGAYLDTETDLAPDIECVPPTQQPVAFVRIEPGRAAELIAAVVA